MSDVTLTRDTGFYRAFYDFQVGGDPAPMEMSGGKNRFKPDALSVQLNRVEGGYWFVLEARVSGQILKKDGELGNSRRSRLMSKSARNYDVDWAQDDVPEWVSKVVSDLLEMHHAETRLVLDNALGMGA